MTETLKSELQAYDHAITNTVSLHVNINTDPAFLDRPVLPRSLPEPSPDWEIDVGAIAYQLRSSLDQLVAQLAAANGVDTTDYRRGGFPIFTDRTNYNRTKSKAKSPRNTKLHGVPPDAKKAIDGVQPFVSDQPAQHPLARLDRLCNLDKHRGGHPSLTVLRGTAVVLSSVRIGQSHAFREAWTQGRESLDRNTPWSELLGHPSLDAAIDSLDRSPLSNADDRRWHVLLRIGVAFGPDRILWPDINRIVDYVERDVVPPLEEFVA